MPQKKTEKLLRPLLTQENAENSYRLRSVTRNRMSNRRQIHPRNRVSTREPARMRTRQVPAQPVQPEIVPVVNENEAVPEVVMEHQSNQNLQQNDSLDGNNEMEELYTKIRSIPNYTAKLADFLKQNHVHSTHRRIVKKTFPRRHIIVHFPYQIFMADLIEYTQSDYKHANHNYAYILVVIDVFTKMVYARAVKRKDKFSVSIAMESILLGLDHYPNTLITDEGLEFYNKNVREVLDKFAIHHYSIKTKMKASVVERFNRTLRSKIEKYFVTNNTKKWVDILPQFIKNYNETPHRTIGMAPSKVTDLNASMVFNKMFPDIHLEAKPRLTKGNIVRVLKEKTLFEKGFTQGWSDQCYKVYEVKQAAGRIWYIISDLRDIVLPGIKYYWELNLVAKHDR